MRILKVNVRAKPAYGAQHTRWRAAGMHVTFDAGERMRPEERIVKPAICVIEVGWLYVSGKPPQEGQSHQPGLSYRLGKSDQPYPV